MNNKIIFFLAILLLINSMLMASEKIGLTGFADNIGAINLTIAFPSPPEPAGPHGGNYNGPEFYCEPEWSCKDWGECNNEIHTRECIDTKCFSPDKIETSYCTRYVGDTRIISEINFSAGERKELLIFTYRYENHTIRIVKITPEYADIEISSETISLRIYVNETKYVDINKDAIEDISIRLNDVQNGRAFITVKIIPAARISLLAPPVSDRGRLILLAISVLIIILVLWLILKQKEKHRKNRNKA